MNELLCEVLNMCYRISNESKADVFFQYSPHCGAYDVYYYREGWTEANGSYMEYINNVTKITKKNLKVTLAKLAGLATELEVL